MAGALLDRFMQIDCDFPGGNIVVDDISGDRVALHQDLRDTDRDWFYWYFRVRGAAGRKVEFNFTASRALGTRGPAVSVDGGLTWSWLGQTGGSTKAFEYQFGEVDEEVRFSFAMPYVLGDWQRFAAARPWIKGEMLARTRGGRAVPLVKLEGGRQQIVIAARHHCCEMMANYAIEGLIDFIHDSVYLELLRQRATIHIVPMMDLDGVEAGDQGKGRRPRDHGRDYNRESIYPEVAAMRQYLERIKPTVVLDLHGPWIDGPDNEKIYLVGRPEPQMERAQRRFSLLLESVMQGALPFHAEGFLPFGSSWNTAANTGDGLGLAGFAAVLAGVELASAIELPYANVGTADVTAGSARAFGADLARAIAVWVEQTS